jgi:hypothetical protein
MPETTPLIKAALNLRVGAGFDVYEVPVMNTEQHVQSANYSIQKAARDVLV